MPTPLDLSALSDEQLDKTIEEARKAGAYTDAGIVNYDVAKSYVDQSKGDLLDALHGIVNHGDRFTRGQEQRQIAEAGMAAAGLGPVSGYLGAVTENTLRSLTSSITGAADLGADVLLNPLSPLAPLQRPLKNLTHKAREFVDTKMFGMPEDLIERAGYESEYPKTSKAVGEVAAFIATSAVIPPLKFLPPILQAGSISKLTAVAALTGGIVGAATAPEDAHWLDRVSRAAVGMGAGAFVSTALAGRSASRLARGARLGELVSALEDAGMGKAMKLVPRITFARLVHSAISGSAYSVTTNVSKGMPVEEAIGHGVEEGLLWMGADVALAGVGKLANWMPIHAQVTRSVTEKLMAWKIPSALASTAGQGAQIGTNALPGALIGGLVGGAPGAALGGALSAAKASGVQKFLDSATARFVHMGVEPQLVRKLVTGNWASMTGEEAATITKAILVDSVKGTALTLEEGQRRLLLLALGEDAINSPELRKLAVLKGETTKAFAALIMQGVPETDPRMIQLAKSLFALQERTAQIYDNIGATFKVPTLGTFGKDVAEKELTTSVEQVFLDAEQEIVQNTLTPAKIKQLTKGIIAYTPTPSGLTKITDIFGGGNARVALEKPVTKETGTKIYPGFAEAKLAEEKAAAIRGDIEGSRLEEARQAAMRDARQDEIDGILTPSKIQRFGEGILAVRVTPSVVTKATGALGKRAPAGARNVKGYLDSTITPQGISGIPLNMADAKNYFARKGMTLSVKVSGSGVRYTLTGAGDVGRIAEGTSLQEVYNKVADFMRVGESGYAQTKLLTAIAKVGGGAFISPLVTDAIGLTDENDSVLKKMGYGALAGLGLAALGMRGAGATLTTEGQQVLKYVKRDTQEQLAKAEAQKYVGKSGNSFKAKIGDRSVSGRFLYWLLPHEQQIEHTVATMDKAANLTRMPDAAGRLRNIDQAARRKLFEKDLFRFAPFFLNPQEYARIEESFLAATSSKALGYTDQEAYRLFVGWQGWMTTELAQRGKATRANFDLWALAKDASNPLGASKNYADLRNRILSGEIVAGEPLPLPAGYNRASKLRTMGSQAPVNTAVNDLVETLQSIKPHETVGTAETIYPNVFNAAGIGPNISVLRYGMRLSAQGDPVGQKIINIAKGIFDSATRIKKLDDASRREILGFFQGVSSKAEHDLVRDVMETAGGIAAMSGKNDAVVAAATGTKQYLEGYAAKLGLPPGMKIEEYFPWVFNHNTVAELKELSRKGITPKIVYPTEWSGSMNVFFNHLESRTNAFPQYAREAPVTSLLMYSHGANRKLVLDELLANITPETIKEIAATQPYVAKQIGNWLLDTIGVPGPGTLYTSKKLENLGLALKNLPMFNHHTFQSAIDEWLTSKNNAQNVSKLVTHWAYTTKIAWNWISPLINVSQWLTGGATDVGLFSLFKAIPAGVTTAVSEAADELGLPFLSPFLDATVPNVKAYRRMLKERGIFGHLDQALFDDIAKHEAVYGEVRPFSVFSGATTGGTAGSALTAGYNLLADDDASIAMGALAGAGVAGLAASRVNLSRKLLMHTREASTFMFNFGETLNRSVTGIGGFKEAVAAEKAAKNAAYAAVQGTKEVIEHTIVGAFGGGALGYMSGEEGNAGASTVGGALLGAAALGGAFALKGERNYIRVQRSRMNIERYGQEFVFGDRIIHEQAKKGMLPFTANEINELYAAQVVEFTQFRMGKEARGRMMNTPTGQAMGALQSYTINQLDFIGGRAQSFWESLARSMNGEGTAIDFRVFRYGAFVMGMGAVYSALFSGLGYDHNPKYWMSRVGFGILPFLRYDDQAKSWEVNVLDTFKGPVISDIENSSNNILKLLSDPDAHRSFLDVADDVAKKIFIGARQIQQEADKNDGVMLKSLLKEGVLDGTRP